MSKHRATIEWVCHGPAEEFCRGRYSREHLWIFDGGARVNASPSPSIVPPPWSSTQAVDPEEAFVASISSCHMLTFLWLASQHGFAVARYRDDAVGAMKQNERGAMWVHRVVLAPEITYIGDRDPSRDESKQLHREAHEQCFIANSVRTEIVVEPRH